MMGPPARLRPKAHVQKQVGMVEIEKMDSFEKAMSPKPNSIANLSYLSLV